jgi:hypothetical protein
MDEKRGIADNVNRQQVGSSAKPWNKCKYKLRLSLADISKASTFERYHAA